MKGLIMTLGDKILLRKRAIIETINDELKNIARLNIRFTDPSPDSLSTL